MSNLNIPSRNPAAEGHLGGVLKVAIKKAMQAIDGQLPCIVVSYDRVANRALVRPLISLVTTTGEPIVRAQVASVPVLALGGGGFCINFPLQPGDLGWIEASDRDISLFIQQMQQSKPNTFRMHSFEDGRFIPDAFRRYTFNSEDAANMVIQSYDGTVKIALGPDLINVVAPNVTVNATTTIVNSDVTTVNSVTATINAATASIVAATSATIQSASIVLKNSGAAIHALINELFLSWSNTHVHSNGNGGANTGVPTTTPSASVLTSATKAE